MIAIIAPTRDSSEWINWMTRQDPTIEIETYPNISDPEKVICAVVWLHPYGVLQEFPNLKLICSMGAGVDHILKDPNLPMVPITRVVSERLAFSMNTYVSMAVLNYHRKLSKYVQDQTNKIWDQDTFPERELKIGIYGFGYLGQKIGGALQGLGFEVHGFSTTRKQVEGIKTYDSSEEKDFLESINVLVGVLPMTEKTKSVFSMGLFSRLKEPTYFINVGRGNQQVERDIVSAIDQGILTGAMLDVFEQEPLDQSSELWEHPKVSITPHIAGITNPEAAVPQILENYVRMKEGRGLLHEVNPSVGY